MAQGEQFLFSTHPKTSFSDIAASVFISLLGITFLSLSEGEEKTPDFSFGMHKQDFYWGWMPFISKSLQIATLLFRLIRSSSDILLHFKTKKWRK